MNGAPICQRSSSKYIQDGGWSKAQITSKHKEMTSVSLHSTEFQSGIEVSLL